MFYLVSKDGRKSYENGHSATIKDRQTTETKRLLVSEKKERKKRVLNS